MKEKGFATIFGLCLILVIALVAKGIQESEKNHAYEMTDFQAETELQNAADFGIYAARNQILSGEVEISLLTNVGGRASYRKKFRTITKTSDRFDTEIKIEVWGEHLGLQPYNVKYGARKKVGNKVVTTNIAKKNGEPQEVYTFFSVASVESNRMEGKIYRRAFAYMLAEKNPDETYKDTTIHFMELPSSTFDFE